MTITSTAFQQDEQIPKDYSQDGKNVNPPLTFSEVSVQAKSLVLVVDDPDAPNGTFTHWILYNMSPATLQILEGQLPLNAVAATNDIGNQRYDGPRPPSGTHRYRFRLLALDTTLEGMRPTDNRAALNSAIKGHIIDQAQLTGLYSA